MTVNKRIIVALDRADSLSAQQLIDRLNPADCRLKIGMELFTAVGPSIIHYAIHRGFDVFLDLKYHDIPTTVANACTVAGRLGVWMLTVHICGGIRMLHAARTAIDTLPSPRPLLVGVSVLTSMTETDLYQTGVGVSIAQHVENLKNIAINQGLDGIVCSASDIPLFAHMPPESFAFVTPGIRTKIDETDDQRRVVMPKEALDRGATFLVIGRPITGSEDPTARLRSIRLDIGEVV